MKFTKPQYVNEFKFRFPWFSIFRPRTSPPVLACVIRGTRFNLEGTTNLRTRFVCLFSCPYSQSNYDETIEKTIVWTNFNFHFPDFEMKNTRRLQIDIHENWESWLCIVLICSFVIWLSHYLAIYDLLFILFSVPNTLLQRSIGSFYCFNFLISIIRFSG